MKILLIKTSALGDIVHCFPVVEYLRKKCPFGKIDWVVERSCRELVEAHPEIDRKLIVDTGAWRRRLWRHRQERKSFLKELKARRYDVIFDLQGNLKSSWVTYHARGRCKVGFDRRGVAEWPNLLFTDIKVPLAAGQNIRDDYLQIVGGYFKERAEASGEVELLCDEPLPECFVGQKRVLVCPFAAWKNKELKKKQLISALREIEGAALYFIWGSKKERGEAMKLAGEVDGTVMEKLSLPLLQKVMKASHLVVSMDSLPLHLAATTGVPTWSFFGPSSANKYAPMGEQHQAIQGVCPFGFSFSKRCPKLRTCASGACSKEGKI